MNPVTVGETPSTGSRPRSDSELSYHLRNPSTSRMASSVSGRDPSAAPPHVAASSASRRIGTARSALWHATRCFR